MSSREKPNAVWVRSLVPKEKNSATSAISPATRAAGGGERDHDLDDGVAAVALDLAGGLHDRPDLHGVQAWLDDAQAESAQAQHGVGLVEVVDLGEQLLGLGQGQRLVAGDLVLVLPGLLGEG